MEITLSRLNPANGIRRKCIPLTTRLIIWHERYRQRRALMRLDDRMLKDIGISRCEAEREHEKPFWVE